MKKAAIIVDGSNISASANILEMKVDYKAMTEYFSQKYDLFRCMYFTALPPKNVESDLRKLTDWLKFNEWALITKETKEYHKADGSVTRKGNMDVEIAIHTYEVAKEVDEILLFTGDGDFAFLVETVQRMQKKVTVISAKVTMSDRLRAQADKFIDMADLRSYIGRARAPRNITERRYNFLTKP